MKLLIDADSLIYKAGCANETREYLVQDKESGVVLDSFPYKAEATAYVQDDESLEIVFTKYAGDLSHSLSNAKRTVTDILDNFPGAQYQLYIGGDNNFRYHLYPEYKQNRDPNARPIHEQEIREYLIRAWKAEVVHNEEADDRVSYLCCEDLENNIIVGIDKDLWGTPGWHYNPDKKIMEEISLDSANRHFWHQMLTGDTSDNIPCLKGVGPKTADKLLDTITYFAEGVQDTVWLQYKERGHTEDYYNLMGQLLWLRRKPNQMWEPRLAV